MSRASLEAQTTQTNLAVIVQHAPTLTGGAVIQGSLQQLDGENVTLNGGFLMSGDLLVPGTPTVVTNGNPTYAGTVPGGGSSSPSGYQIVLDGNSSFNYLRTQTTPVTLPTVSNPPAPTGTRSVTITHAGQSYGDPNTLLNLTLAGNAGLLAVPPGTYGDFAVSGGAGLVIGVAGAVQPATYNLQDITLTGNATLKVVGPVVLTIANGFTNNGCVGSSNNPAWLRLNIASGNCTLIGGSILYGLVTAPNGEVTVEGNATLVGTSASANFDIVGGGLVRWGGTAQVSLPPVATNQTFVLAENSATNITLTGFDPQNLPLTYSVLTEPAHGVLSGTPPNLTYQPATNFYGDDSFTFNVNNGITNSATATISLVVTQVYYPPTASSQSLTNLENAPLAVTLTGSDPQNYPLTYSIVTQPAHGALSGTAPNLVYQPATNYFGNDVFTFEANDGVSNSAPATISITIEAVDEAPMVSAGSNQLIILPNKTVNLNGTVTYADFPDTVDTVIWSQASGPGTVAFGDASNTTTTATFSTSGVYVLQLFASDSYLSASNDVTVTVDAPPVVNAGPETTNTFPGSIALQGTANDDGLPYGVLNLSWSEVSGPGTVIFANPSATNSMATFSTNGIYDLRLTADDGVATNYSDVTVIENMPPTVNAGVNILTNGLAAMLNGSVSDDGLPSGYLAVQWVQSSGPGTATFSDPTSTNTAVSVDQSGVFVFTLIATDGAATNSSEVAVTFNLPPVVTAGTEQTVNFGTVVTLAGVATDDHLPYNILDTVWSEVSGPGTATFAGPTLTNTTVTFDQAGVYDLRLTADDGFATNLSDVTIQVHAAPIVSAGSNQVSGVGSPVTLAGSFIDDGLAGPATAQWTQISGPAGASIADPAATNTAVTFSQDGIYVFALTVTDGLTNGSAQVTITLVNPPGVTVATPSIIINWPANQVTLNGTATADGLPSGGTLTGTWSQLSGPAAATLSNPVQSETLNGSPVSLPCSTLATFSTSGVYTFQLAAANQVGSAQTNITVIVNQPPVANAGPEQTVNFGTVVTLAGVATDDHLPYNILDTVWSEVSGPGTAAFAHPTLTNTTVTFNQPGVYDLRLTVDDGFATNSADVTIQVHAVPTVFAGTNQVIAFGAPATLAGSFVDDGLAGPATVQWTQVSGPVAATIANPTATNSAVTFSQDGLYVFALTVSDSLTNSSAQVTIASVKPPLVTVAPASFLINWPSNQVTLNGTATADGLPPGGTLTATWSQISGPATATLSNPVQSETLNGSPVSLPLSSTATFSGSGVYVFQFAATNQAGGAQSNVFVTVNQPPVVNAGATQTNLFPAAAHLSGTVTDDGLPAGGQLTWSWSAVSGPGTATFNNPALTNATATFSKSGIYVLQLTASDSAAVSSNQVVIIEDTAPIVRLTTNQVPAGTNQVVLTGTVTDDGLPPGAELTAAWGLVNGPAAVAFNPPVQTGPLSGVPVTNVVQSTATFSVSGTYVISLTANDSFATNSATISLSVTSTPPVVYAGPDQYLSGVPATTTLNGQVSDAVLPFGATLTQQWSLVGGPGTVTFGSPTLPVTTATFSTNGIYVLELTANNGQSQASSMVEVRVETLCMVEDPQGLAAWWPANGNVMDVVSGQSGILNGANYTNGEVGLAFNFDGTDDYVRVPGATNYNVGASPAGMTMEFWMNPNSQQNGSVLGWANSIRVEREPNNWNGAQLRCYLGTGGQFVQTPGPVWNNTNWGWTHVAVTYAPASGEAVMYINGSISATVNMGTNLMSTTNDFYMGQVPGSANNFSGQLDEISLYRRPLNPQEVYNIYASGSVGKCPDDTNTPPVVYAGPDLFLSGAPATASLNGQVSDAVLPAGGALSQQWTVLSGPGPVTFGSPTLPVTTATFSTNGIYLLQLTANNGETEASSLVEVRVESLCTVEDPEGLAAWWPADGAANDVISGNYGILGGSTSYTNGEVGFAFNFDGLDDFVDVPGATNYDVGSSPSGLTLEFWMNPNSQQNGSVLGWANSIRVEREPNNWNGAQLRCYLGTGQQFVQTPGPVWNNTSWGWTHVAVTYDRSSGLADIYINGSIQASANVGTNLLSTTNDFYMGQVPGSANFYSGQLDEISLYRRPLNPEEVYNIFASGSVGKCPNDTNAPPQVSAGPDLFLGGAPATATLNGQVSDPALPLGGTLSQQWSVAEGPGTVTFGSPSLPVTTATFSTNGIYLLQLTANNGEAEASSLVEVRVESLCMVEDPEGLAAWWPGDGTSEDALSGYFGILGGSTSYTNGEVGLAFNFDGADDFVDVPGATNYDMGSSPSGLTLEFWMKPNSFQNGSVLGWANSIRVEREPNNWNGAQLRCYLGTAGQFVQTPGYVWNNTSWGWTHVAVTYDRSSGMADIYINGSIQASAEVGTNLLSTTNDFYMGQVPGSANFYSGQLDEISLYRRPLNPEEVYSIYASGSVGKCPNDTNTPPTVYAGPDLYLRGAPATATLNGQVADAVLPPGGTLSQQWSVVSGPGTVIFGSPTLPMTTAMFSTNGIYVLQLAANNGEAEASSLVEVRVESLCMVEDPEGLAAWWPADGTAEDVISGNYGILGGSTSYTNGEVAMAFNFDGLDDFVDVPGATNYDVGSSPSGLTLEFWMNPNSFQNGSVLGWANSIRVEREPNNWNGAQLRCYLGTGGQFVQTPSYVWSNTNWGWTHVAVTYDAASGEAVIYINGSISASANVGTKLTSTTNDFYMGQVPGSANYYSGQLDEISLYRRPLNPEELYNIYASGSVGKCPDTNTLSVYAGPNFAIPSPTDSALLTGSVTENGQPAGTNVQVQWTEYYGPGTVTFGDATSAISPVMFSTSGIYILQLTANNGDEQSSGLVDVRVGVPCNDQDLSGLSAWWPADGTAEDVIGGKEAILGGSTSYTNGEVALAFNFDGFDDFVWAPSATNYNVGASPAGMTVEFWMNPNSMQNGSVLGWANSIRVEREPNNWNGAQLRCYLGTSGQFVQTPGPVWNNTSWGWTHVAVTYDKTSGTADMYINGSISASVNVGTSLLSTTNDFYMGQVPGSANFYSGQLDEVSLYSQPLSSNEIAAIYASGRAGKCPNNLNLIVNQAPVITQFTNVLINWPTIQVLLNGAVTDDGLPIDGVLSANWSQISGPGTVTFSPQPASIPLDGEAVTNPVSTEATFSAPGLYVLQLTASDSLLTNSIQIVATVNQPPVVNGGGNQVIPFASSAYLHGTVQDDGLPVGSVVTNEWLQISGPGIAAFASPNDTNTTVAFSKPGTYQLELLASDTAVFSSNVVTITMVQANASQPPLVYAGPNQTIGGTNIALLQGLVTGGTQPVTSSWSVQSGPGSVAFANSNSPATVATFSNPGTYVLTLSARDPYYTVSGNVVITVDPYDQLVTVYPGPDQTIRTNVTDLPGEVTVDGLATNAPLAIQWSQISGPAPAFFAAPSFPNTTVSFKRSGNYVLQLSASPGPYTVSSNVTITVLPYDEPPIVNAGPNQEIWNTNQTILQGTVMDPSVAPGAALRTIWSVVSAPSTVTFANVNATNSGVTFGDQGSYQLRLTATDGILTNSDDVTIIVAANNSISYQSTNTLYRYGFLTNFFATTFNDSIFTNGQAGFGNYGTCSINSTNFIHTYWPGAVGGVPNLMIRKHFFVPPGTTNLSMGFTVDNDAEIYINGTLITPTNITQFIVNNGSDSRFDGTPGDSLYDYWRHDNCPAYDDLVLAGIYTNLWHAGENVLAVLVYDDGGVCFFDNRITPNASLQQLLNTAPMPVIANTNPVVVLSSLLDLRAQIEDDGLPTNAPYKNATWSQVSGPGTATFSQPVSSFLTNNDASTYVSFSAPGTYQLQLLADDSEFQGVAYAWVFVASSSNELITVSAGPNQTVPLDASAVLDGTVTSSGSASGTVTTSWSAVSGPGTVSFTTINGINYASFSAVGDYVLQFTGSNGQYSSSSTMTVHVIPPFSRSLNFTTSYPTQTDLSIGANLNAQIIDQGQPAGSVLTDEWVTVSGPAQAVFSQEINNFPNLSAHADFPVTGNYVLGLVAGDGQLLGTAQMPINVTDLYQGRRPPTVSVGQPKAVPVNTPIALSGTAVDNDATNGTFTTDWSELSGPAQVTFANAAQTNTTVTFGAPGNYVLQLTASDGQLSSSATVDMVATNTASSSLLVYAGGNASLVLPEELEIDALVIDENSALALSYQWTNVSGPGTVIFLATNITTNVTAWLPVKNSEAPVIADFSAPGNYQLQLNGTDGTVTNSDILDVTVLPATNAFLSVSAGPPQTIVLPNEAALQPVITEDNLPNGQLSLSWTEVSGPGTVAFSQNNSGGEYAAFSTTGIYDIQVIASDGLYSATNDVIITVDPPTAPPLVQLSLPLDSSVITSPTQVVGTVSSPILQSYGLQIRLETSADTNAWVTFAGGSNNVYNGNLGTLDPTLSLNGVYELRLVATDQSGQTAVTDPITVIFDRNLKVGNFRISFNDLSVPVPGLPIKITRTYDTLAANAGQQGDFGIGWTMDILNVRLQKNRSLSKNWYQYSTGDIYDFSLAYHLDSGSPRIVTITFPDGTVEKFQFQPNPTDQSLIPIENPQWNFVPLDNTKGTLEPASYNDPDGSFLQFTGDIPDYGDLVDFNYFYEFIGDFVTPIALSDLENYPTLFRYTSADGYGYLIDENNGLQSVTDPNGNTLTVATNGLTWQNPKSGTNTVSVAFQRDSFGRITNIVDMLGHSLVYRYDTNGNLATFVNRDGETNTFAYTNVAFPNYLTSVTDAQGTTPVQNQFDSSGRLVGNSDAFGDAVTYGNDLSENREYVTNQLGDVTISDYDNNGNVIHTINPDGGQTFTEYDEDGNILTNTDELGRTTTYTYDDEDNRTSVTDPLGNITRFTYGVDRRVASVTDPRGNSITNTYDSQGNLTAVRDPLGYVTTYFYNDQGKPLGMQNALGQTMSYGYDGAGHLTSELDGDGHETDYTYDGNGNILSQTTTRTTPQGVQTLTAEFHYDAQNHLTNSIFPDGSTAQTIYNADGQPVTSIDQLGRQTTKQYDALGRVINTTYPDGSSEGVAYDAANERIALTNRLGEVTRFEYDSMGRSIGRINPDGTSTTNTYDLAGQLVSSTDERGYSTFNDYDADGRTVAVTNALTEVSYNYYDGNGNLTNSVDALGRSTAFVYDALNRRIETIFADGTRQHVWLDALGRRVYSQDQAGKVTAFGYDTLSRLVAVTNALGYVTSYAYDELGEQTNQTDANNHATTLTYDDLGRPIQRTLPGGQIETYAYDLAGNLTNQTDFNGYTTAYQYDSMNRLVAKIPDPRFGERSVTFAYSAGGMRTNMTDASGITTYQYDSNGRLAQKARTWNSVAVSVSLNYTHDAAGNVTSIQSSESNGVNVTYGYDALERLSTVSDAAAGTTAYGYDAVGNLQSCTYPNSVSSQYQYDSLSRLTNLASSQLNLQIANYAYTVGPVGNRLTASEQLFGSVLNARPSTIYRTFSYDNIYQLTGETINGASSGTLGYHYDPAGNRLSRNSTSPALQSQSFSFDPDDRLNTDTYDANGNTQIGAGFGQTRPDQYDFENRLVTRSTPGATVSIQYDGDGNRVSKKVTTATNTVTTIYVVDENNPSGYAQVLEELVSANSQAPALDCVYTYGHTLISQDRLTGSARTISFYGYDGHNNVRYLTDASGDVTDTYDYDAFGNLISGSGSTENVYLFTGEQFDPDLGLYFLRGRYQNPDTGRFWSMDTVDGNNSDPLSLHKYLYCDNDPANGFDPSGHDGIEELTISMAIWPIAHAMFGATIGGLTGSLAAGYDALLHGQVSNQQIAQAMSAGFKEGAITGAFLGGISGLGSVGAFGASAIGLVYSGEGWIASYQSYLSGNYPAAAFEGAMATIGDVTSIGGLTAALTSDVSGDAVVLTPNGFRNAVWELDVKARGLAIEKAWGGNLPRNFKTYDRWFPATETATSIKSIDLDATSYQTGDQVYSLMQGYIDDIIDFDEYTLENFTLRSSDIQQRVLRVAIPRGPSGNQILGMQRAVDYGKLNNVTVQFNVY